MKIIKTNTFGWENALCGMRYPKNSEHLMDSSFNPFMLGIKDASLLFKLTVAGKDHRKVLRMIHIQTSIKMPISWWIQFDTYKVGTTANSRSRMHKLGSSFLTKDDFYVKDYESSKFKETLKYLNQQIYMYQEYKKDNQVDIARQYWRNLIDYLPMSYEQERMVDFNYEVMLAICNSRWNEKLSEEWKYFIKSICSNCDYLVTLWKLDSMKIRLQETLERVKENENTEYYRYLQI